MSNTQQINMQSKIEQIKKEIDLLQDRIRLMHIRRIRVKKGQRTDLSQTKEIQNIVKDTLQNKTKQIERNTNILQTILAQVKKKKEVIWKRTEENSKNLSQNELNQIAEMRDQSRHEISKEELIISLLK